MGQRICSIDGCEKAVQARALCQMHYRRWRLTGDAGEAAARFAPQAPICSVLDCGGPTRAKGLCTKHYQNKQSLGRYEAKRDLPLIARLVEVGWDETERGCWEWRGTRNEANYGLIAGEVSSRRVHRLMWEMHNGPIPDELVVRHRCDNPPCVNPHHLELGTKKDNADDMVRRTRHQSYRSDWWDGLCKNGLHDVTAPDALISIVNESGNPGFRCRGCRDAYQLRREIPDVTQ